MLEAELILSDTPVGEIETALLSGYFDLAVLAAPFGAHERLRHTELYREDMVATGREDNEMMRAILAEARSHKWLGTG